MEDTPNENEPKTSPQLTGKVFIRSENKCHSDSTNKKFDNIIARALTNIKVYDS